MSALHSFVDLTRDTRSVDCDFSVPKSIIMKQVLRELKNTKIRNILNSLDEKKYSNNVIFFYKYYLCTV